MAPGSALESHASPASPLLVALLLVATLPGATAQGPGADLTLTPTQASFGPGEDVVLRIQNNGSAPTQGTPSIEVHHCPLGPDLCAPREVTVHTWQGAPIRLGPGDAITHTWNRTTGDGQDAPEGTYEAHLNWNATAGDDQQATSPRFTLEGGPDAAGGDPNAPAIRLETPGSGTVVEALRVDVEAQVTGTDQLTGVDATIDGRSILRARDLDQASYSVDTSVALAPGLHVLEISARDDEGRTNRTRIAFTVAPLARQTVGEIAFDATAAGGLEDVRWSGERLFERVTATGEAGFRTSATGSATLLTAVQAGTIELVLAEGWQATPREAGVALDHAASGARVLLTPLGGAPTTVLEDRVTVHLAEGEALAVRPVGPGADAAIADAILAGDVGAEIDLSGDQPGVRAYRPVEAALAPQEGRVVAILHASDPGPQAYVFDLAPGFAQAEETLSVTVDGQPIAEATSIEDALDTSDDGGRPEAYIAQEDGDRQVVVGGIEGQGAREVAIQVAEGVGAFLTPASVLAALALVGLSAWALFRRPD